MESDKKNAFLKFGLVELGIVGVIIIVILLILYFLDVLPFDLPGASKTSLQTTLSNTIVKNALPVKKTGYLCIFDENYCSQAEQISISQNNIPSFIGLGFTNISKGTPVKAVMPGTVGIGITTDTKGNKITLISILDENGKVEADYRFIGTPFTPTPDKGGKVTEGEVVGWIGEKLFPLSLNNKEYNLILTFQDKMSKKYIVVKSSELK